MTMSLAVGGTHTALGGKGAAVVEVAPDPDASVLGEETIVLDPWERGNGGEPVEQAALGPGDEAAPLGPLEGGVGGAWSGPVDMAACLDKQATGDPGEAAPLGAGQTAPAAPVRVELGTECGEALLATA